VANVILSKWRQSANSSGSLSERLHTLETLKAQFSSVAVSNKGNRQKLSLKDIKVITKYLSRDKQQVVLEKEVIKLVDDSDSREVTAIDHGVLEMKSAILRLETQVQDIQTRIERFVV
jgi:charged multivesicular body protein 7